MQFNAISILKLFKNRHLNGDPRTRYARGSTVLLSRLGGPAHAVIARVASLAGIVFDACFLLTREVGLFRLT